MDLVFLEAQELICKRPRSKGRVQPGVLFLQDPLLDLQKCGKRFQHRVLKEEYARLDTSLRPRTFADQFRSLQGYQIHREQAAAFQAWYCPGLFHALMQTNATETETQLWQQFANDAREEGIVRVKDPVMVF